MSFKDEFWLDFGLFSSVQVTFGMVVRLTFKKSELIAALELQPHPRPLKINESRGYYYSLYVISTFVKKIMFLGQFDAWLDKKTRVVRT